MFAMLRSVAHYTHFLWYIAIDWERMLGFRVLKYILKLARQKCLFVKKLIFLFFSNSLYLVSRWMVFLIIYTNNINTKRTKKRTSLKNIHIMSYFTIFCQKPTKFMRSLPTSIWIINIHSKTTSVDLKHKVIFNSWGKKGT